MPTVTELADAEEAKAVALKAYLDEHVQQDKDGKAIKDEKTGRPVYDLDAEGVKKVREMNTDLNAAHDAWLAAKTPDDAAQNADTALKRAKPEEGRKIIDGADLSQARPSALISARAQIKALISESAKEGGLKDVREARSSFRGRKELFTFGEDRDPEETDALIDAVKTTIALTDIAPPADRSRVPVLPSVQNRIVVSDLMGAGATDSNTLSYWEETTFTNAAAETAEAVAKPESTLDFTERTDTVRKIATWIPITDEALADNSQLRSYVEGRLLFMVRQREETQLLTGNGTGVNIQGVINRSGIQTQAKGADATMDSFYKAKVKVQVTGDADPDGFVAHPNDWTDIQLLRTADGIYILGNPAADAPVRLWGMPGRITTGITEGTGLVGAFGIYSQVFRRAGLTVVASTEHASFFTENKIALLAETRLALAVYRAAAFCTVTGI